MLGLFAAEPDVPKYVAGRGSHSNLLWHVTLPSTLAPAAGEAGPGIAAGPTPHRVERFAAFASQRRAGHTRRPRTSQRTGFDAQAPCGSGSPGHLGPPLPSASSPADSVPAGRAEAENRPAVALRAERPGRRDAQSRATAAPSRTPLNMQVHVYGVKPRLRLSKQAVSPDAGTRSLRALGPAQVNGSVDMTSTVKSRNVRIARAVLPSFGRASLSVSRTRAIGRNGARNCDG